MEAIELRSVKLQNNAIVRGEPIDSINVSYNIGGDAPPRIKFYPNEQIVKLTVYYKKPGVTVHELRELQDFMIPISNVSCMEKLKSDLNPEELKKVNWMVLQKLMDEYQKKLEVANDQSNQTNGAGGDRQPG